MNTEPQKIIDKFNNNTNVRRSLTEFGYIPHVTDEDILLGAWIKSSLVKLNELRNPFLIMAGGRGRDFCLLLRIYLSRLLNWIISRLSCILLKKHMLRVSVNFIYQ